MTYTITFDCPHCNSGMTLDIGHRTPDTGQAFLCPQCQKEIKLTRLSPPDLGHRTSDTEQSFTIHQCSVCNCRNLHQHKDFNKKLGLALFVIGAAFAPWTYYVSLVAALAIDACLYPFFPWMIVCYKCHAEFRGWPKNNRLNRFNHEVAAHYEYSHEADGPKVLGPSAL